MFKDKYKINNCETELNINSSTMQTSNTEFVVCCTEWVVEDFVNLILLIMVSCRMVVIS